MATQAINTFGELSSTLQSLGFVRLQRDQGTVFIHPAGAPIILLPAYKNEEIVKPIHQVMVVRQLRDSGIMTSRQLRMTRREYEQCPVHPPEFLRRCIDATWVSDGL